MKRQCELDYKLEIFKTIWPKDISIEAFDYTSNKVPDIVDKIYDRLTNNVENKRRV